MIRALNICLWTTLFIWSGGYSASGQLSPGKLAESHAGLEGLSNCTKCHELGEKVSDQKCLDCHKDLAARISAQLGYHASTRVQGNSCTKCHSDHHGREFEMIHFEPESFDHTLTGYELLGQHSRTICGDCHRTEFITDPVIKRKKRSYMGLERSCSTCHEDSHQGTLSGNCSSCHNYEAFSPASGFDHAGTRFRLKGKHAETACAECHEITNKNGKRFQQFAGVDFSNCTSCHTDVHQNKFGQNCARCHTEESFTRIRQSGNFNHDLTDFPLHGLHSSVSCDDCHRRKFSSRTQYDQCLDCHSDYHHGEFASQGNLTDCSECHTTNGFSQHTFTIERHEASAFVLKGAHLATPCFACHMKGNRWKFRDTGKNCSECHQDIHVPYLDRKYYPGSDCEQCHNSDRWSKVSFEHSRTGFSLEGAHLQQSCKACHWKENGEGKPTQVFALGSSGCLSCHKDEHMGQFRDEGDMSCLKCHGYGDWSASRFDHDQADFKLDGRHREVACAKCHIPVTDAGITYTKYKFEDYSCESCH